MSQATQHPSRRSNGSEVIDLNRLRRPGAGARPHRVKRALAVCQDYVRQQDPTLQGEALTRKAHELYDQLQETHPHALAEFARTAPSSRAPDRRHIHDKIEIAAMRSLPQGQKLEAILASCRMGRPTDRSLPISILECNAWAKGPAEVRSHYKDFLGSDALLDWAYGHPLGANGERRRCESTVYHSLGAMLDRHDPEVCIALNLEAIRELAKKHPEIGRYVVVDGTDFRPSVEQCSAISPSEEPLLRRGMGARVISHGPGKIWRGWVLLQLTDVASTLPLAWALLPLDTGREFLGVTVLLDTLFKYWPECPIEYLIGDREFDVEELSAELEFRYGIHPVWPMRGSVASKYSWSSSVGVPECSKHGLMKLKWAQDFLGKKGRRRDGIRQGDIDSAQMKARLRWTCEAPGCSISAATYPKDNARLYTYLPHQGAHKRTGLRIALLQRRNSIESVIGEMKRRGVGLKGQSHPRWVSTDRQAAWLAGAALLGQTLRRLAHESGAYSEAEDKALTSGLLKPCARRL